MNMPGPTSALVKNARRARRARGAHVTLTKSGAQVRHCLHAQVECRRGTRGHALRALLVAVEDPGALQRQDRGYRSKLELALDAAADNGGRSCVAPGQEFRGHRCGRPRAEGRHTAGFDDGERHAVIRIGEHNGPLDRGEAKPSRVLREIRIRLGGEIAALTDEPGRFDMESAVRGRHAENAWSERAAFGVETERALHRADTVRKRQEIQHLRT